MKHCLDIVEDVLGHYVSHSIQNKSYIKPEKEWFALYQFVHVVCFL